MSLNTTFITTLHHNVGDDFVRGGIQSLLSDTLKTIPGFEPHDVCYRYIHKHSPVTCVNGFGTVRSTRLSNLLEPLTRRLKLPNAISTADLLIQSGAPIYWYHPGHSSCDQNEWYKSLILKRYARLNHKIPLFNLAGGSCQRFHSDGSEFLDSPKTLQYISDFFSHSNITTLRDSLAQRILALAGHKAEVLPCTSIFARDHHEIRPKESETIVLNFMQNGGHFTFGQTINSLDWQRRFAAIASAAQQLGPVVLACHNEKEDALAKELFPEYQRFLVPNDPTAFMDFYSSARFGIVNRVHAGFMLASLGKPVVVIGSDSRARMIELLGLSSFYVNEVPEPQELLSSLLSLEENYSSHIEWIRQQARSRYIELLKPQLRALVAG